MKSTTLHLVIIFSIVTYKCFSEGRPQFVDPNQVHDQFRKNQEHEPDEEDISQAQFSGYRNNCVPQADACLCIIGTEAHTGLEVLQVHTTEAACKCRRGELGNGCPPNPHKSTGAARTANILA